MCGKTEKQHPVLEQISEPLSRIIEAVQDNQAEKIKSSFLGSLPDIEALNKKTSYEIDAVRQQLIGLMENIRGLENSSRMLSEQFYEDKIILPMVRGLFPVVDLIEEAEENLQTDASGNQSMMDCLFALSSQIEVFWGCYGIVRFRHRAGEAFDPKVMKPVRTAATEKEELDGCIAVSLQSGFKTDERILRLESVELFKYQSESHLS